MGIAMTDEAAKALADAMNRLALAIERVTTGAGSALGAGIHVHGQSSAKPYYQAPHYYQPWPNGPPAVWPSAPGRG
jgi:hypothetical protein